ncbi:hypothetical protein PEBR_06893 [Penicillium brasilianum]|uniref:Bacteriophage T5 Orf172 DNA-binding domain-containing protein n=1 Tax=Penicillium brasilianum TaxID=104259 RepID=A0A1S9RW95_PENBI|nr:hypothetical protein PEBR_06893 [Penicillium brasilianum]
MKSSEPLFCSLAKLLDWAPDDTPSITCAYFVKSGRRCGRLISQDKSNRARLEFASHVEIITGPSGGFNKASPQFKVVQTLAEIYVCTMHYKHASKAEEQWLEEFNAKSTSGSYKSEGNRGFDISNKHIKETEGNANEIKKAVCEYDLAEREPEKEELSFDEEEVISVLSNQSSQSPGTIRRVLTMREEEVAKAVTWLLKQPLEGKTGQSGWVYVICAPNLPGKFKVGYTLEHPKERRLHDHTECYGEVEIIATKYTKCAYRVEQLLLAEFSNKHYKLEIGCQKCKRCHEELLGIDKKTLLRSLEKWIRFVELPAYDKSGLLRDEAQSRLPRPALKRYLVCRRPHRRSCLDPTSTNKEDSQEPQITPARALNFKAPASIAKNPRIEEVEVDAEDLCSKIEDLQLTPTKSRRKI